MCWQPTLSVISSPAQLVGAVEYTDCISAEGQDPNKCPGYNIKTFDGEAPVLENMEYPFITTLPGPLWPRVIALDRVLSVGQIELFDI